jgi:branched-chain amino acid transport system substrate-binding protein
MFKLGFALALIAALLVFAFAPSARAQSPVQIGALIPLTGALSSYGETSHAALLDAVEQINRKGNRQVELTIEDTGTSPTIVLERLKALHARGIRVVIGPYASSSVQATKAFADEHGMILLSPLSTAQSLAIANDNVLRFTPDDEHEGVAIAVLAQADGIRSIVPVTRNDPGNQGIQAAMQPVFARMGGTVLPTIVYAPDETDFSDEVQAIAAAVNAERAAGHNVGVSLTAFNEVTALFAAAAAGDPVLRTVKWYGSDSVALIRELVEDDVAAAFAVATIYPNPILGLSDDQRHLWEPASERIAGVIGRRPDAFALAAYDAFNVAFDVIDRFGDNDADRLRRNIEDTAAEHIGLTGPNVLNAAGDRALGNYDFWSVCRTASGYEWRRSATFTATEAGGIAHSEDVC